MSMPTPHPPFSVAAFSNAIADSPSRFSRWCWIPTCRKSCGVFGSATLGGPTFSVGLVGDDRPCGVVAECGTASDAFDANAEGVSGVCGCEGDVGVGGRE